jgi:hypothetical protein
MDVLPRDNSAGDDIIGRPDCVAQCMDVYGGVMFHEEKTFTFRFNLDAAFPEDYDGDADNHAWLQEWDKQIKPELLKVVFESLRRHHSWNVHVRNRGISPLDEIEVAMEKDFSKDPSILN